MRWPIAFALIATATAAIGAEPPARLGLEIGGTTIEVEAGQRFELKVDGKSTPARIIELPTRRFDEAGIRFEYPRHFAWEHEPPDTWTLDGNNAVLILDGLEPGVEMTASDLLDGIADELKSDRGTYRPVTLDTKPTATVGVETTFEVLGNRIRYQAYILDRGKVRAMLMLQDSSGAAPAAASEFNELRKRLATTLEF